MTQTHTKHAVRNTGDNVQDATASLTDNIKTQLGSEVKQISGQEQQGYGEVFDSLKEFAKERPATLIFGAICLGLVAAVFFGRRR